MLKNMVKYYVPMYLVHFCWSGHKYVTYSFQLLMAQFIVILPTMLAIVFSNTTMYSYMLLQARHED